MKSESVFAVICSSTPELRSAKFFSTKEKARSYLKQLANERKDKFGVRYFEETEDGFSFLLGWEEYKVKYAMVELEVA